MLSPLLAEAKANSMLQGCVTSPERGTSGGWLIEMRWRVIALLTGNGQTDLAVLVTEPDVLFFGRPREIA